MWVQRHEQPTIIMIIIIIINAELNRTIERRRFSCSMLRDVPRDGGLRPLDARSLRLRHQRHQRRVLLAHERRAQLGRRPQIWVVLGFRPAAACSSPIDKSAGPLRPAPLAPEQPLHAQVPPHPMPNWTPPVRSPAPGCCHVWRPGPGTTVTQDPDPPPSSSTP